MKQLITWTALPNGIGIASDGSGKVLRLSLRVSPRLSPDGGESPLDAFADFVDWTGKDWGFSVRFGNGPGMLAVDHLRPLNSLQPALWRKFFLGDPPVVVRERTVRDYSHPTVRSFPARRIHDFIKAQYTSVALNSPDELPSPENLYGRTGSVAGEFSVANQTAAFHHLDLGDRVDWRKRLSTLIADGVVPHDYPPGISAAAATGLDFLQAEHFHAFKGGRYDQRPLPPSLDFHQILTLLGDYPPLLRALGLLFDIEVPLPLNLSGSGEAIIRIVPETTLADADDSKIALATRYDLDPARALFTAQATGPQLVDGYLDLSGPDFSIAQVDIDGAAIKAINFAQTLADLAIRKRPVLGTPRTAGLPALRSGGLSVLLDDRAAGFVTRLKHGSALEQQLADPMARDDIRLDAESLARGWRVDIRDESKGKWYSLCQRSGEYSHLGDPAGQTVLPKGLVDEGTVTVPAISSSNPSAPPDLYLHEALFHWDGWSLVVSQPGKTISNPVKDATDGGVGHEPSVIANAIGLRTKFRVPEHTLPRLRFGHRYRLRARSVDLAGNSRPLDPDGGTTAATGSAAYLRFDPVASPVIVGEIAMRPGESVDHLVIRSWSAQETALSDETARRHILPPRVAIQIAEQHGMLDAPSPTGPSWYPILAERDAAVTPEALAADDSLDEVPYLPDPLAAGVTLIGLPGKDAPLAHTIGFSLGKDWPSLGCFRIRLEDGPAGYEWRASERLLVIKLPPAERITLRLSSALPDTAALETLGIWDWICQAAPAAWLTKLAGIAVAGRHWMISPFREITLLHAVQTPCAAPRLQDATSVRQLGETFHALSGLLHVHGKSTDKVDFRACWEDLVIAPDNEAGYVRIPHVADACHFKIDSPATLLVPLSERHELGDTRHRRIAYTATATSRFREYFEDDHDLTLPKNLLFTNPATEQRPADFVLEVPSSARPPTPKIEYIIPVFDWSDERHDDAVFRRRSGNLLRVYLGGDWYASGEGELLGVVIAHGPQIVTANGLSPGETKALINAAAPVAPEKLEPLVSRWGIDPIWISGLVHPMPTLHHFPKATARATDLTLAENPPIPSGEPGWSIAVAGHPVAYDRERRLWYCDIEIDSGPSYYPFVRLALARFQSCSVAGAELSRVIAADCVQTAPDRLVSVSDDPQHPAKIRVSLSGVAPRIGVNATCPNRVIVRAEACLPASDPPIWVPVAGPWIALSEMQVSKTVTVWSGTIMLPQIRDAQRYRLVVEEYEFLNADPGRGLDTNAAAQLRALSNVSKSALWPRLVYSDSIELDPAVDTA